MVRYRKINCNISADDKFMFLSTEAKSVFLMIMVSSQSNSIGCFRASKNNLVEEFNLSAVFFYKGFDELIEKNMIQYDDIYRVILLPNFLKYNLPTSPNVIKSWHNTYQELPDSELKEVFLSKLQDCVITLSKGLQKAFADTFLKQKEAQANNRRKPFAIQEQEQEQEQEQQQEHIEREFTKKQVSHHDI